MILLFISFILGLIFLLLEYWCMKHTYTYYRSGFRSEERVEKYETRVINLVGLILVNIIPIVNIVYFIGFWIIMYDTSECDYIRDIKLVPPKELQEEVKMSKLDKLLNKQF